MHFDESKDNHPVSEKSDSTAIAAPEEADRSTAPCAPTHAAEEEDSSVISSPSTSGIVIAGLEQYDASHSADMSTSIPHLRITSDVFKTGAFVETAQYDTDSDACDDSITTMMTDNDVKKSSAGDDGEESSVALSTSTLYNALPNSVTKAPDTISCEYDYKKSISELSNAFNILVEDVLDTVKERVCKHCVVRHRLGVKELEELLSPLPKLIETASYENALLEASRRGDGHALVHLLAMGVNGDCTDSKKRNGLHLACMEGYDNCVYILIDFKAMLRTRGGVTTRPWEPRADFGAIDVFSKTPLDYAKDEMKSKTCVYYLERAIEAKCRKQIKTKMK